MDTFLNESMLGFVAATILFYVGFCYYRKIFRREDEIVEVDSDTGPDELEEQTNKQTQKNKNRSVWKNNSEFSHPWLMKNLNHHPGTVLKVDYSPNGTFLTGACEGGCVTLWDIKDISEKKHKKTFLDISPDYASHVVWSHDSKFYLIHTANSRTIRLCTIEKNPEGNMVDSFPFEFFRQMHDDMIVGCAITPDNKYIMSCSANNDMIIWDAQGNMLTRIHTGLMRTFAVKMSACGTLVAAVGIPPMVKVFEMRYEQKGIRMAFQLSGHGDAVYDFEFDASINSIATISRDGSWKLFDIKDAKNGTQPKLLLSGKYTQTDNMPKIALTRKGDVLAITVDSSVEFYNMYTGKLYNVAKNMFVDVVNDLKFDNSGRVIYICGDRSILLLHNVCAYQNEMDEAKRTLETDPRTVLRDDLQITIERCKSALVKFGKFD